MRLNIFNPIHLVSTPQHYVRLNLQTGVMRYYTKDCIRSTTQREFLNYELPTAMQLQSTHNKYIHLFNKNYLTEKH